MSDLSFDPEQFPAFDREAWRREVEKVLKGRRFEDALVRTPPEGLALEPLYTREDLPPEVAGEAPGTNLFTRGFPEPSGKPGPRRGWRRCVEVEHPDARVANQMLLADLEGGAERVVARVRSARTVLSQGSDSAHSLARSGRGGVWIDDASDLGALLQRVQWSLAPVSIVTPAGDRPFAQTLFGSCASLRSTGGDGLGAQFDLFAEARHASDASNWLSPLKDLAVSEAARAAHAEIASADARPLLVSATAVRHGGGDFVQEVAAALGLFADAMRALNGALAPERVVRATEFRFGVGSDFFGEIAKLRAFRRCLGFLFETLGITDAAADAFVTASSAEESLARHDVHVNLIRASAQATAAVLGGADSAIVLPFDLRLGGGSTLGRRLARNLHSLIDEETDISAVVDAPGGSFYLEHRTEQLAEAAWRQFTEWERGGGFVASLLGGTVDKALEERRRARAARLRSRRDPVLGVSVFPWTDEKRAEPEARDIDGFLERWQQRLPSLAGANQPAPRLWRSAEAFAKAETPAPIDRARPQSGSPFDTVHYLSEDFERLRDEADRLARVRGSAPSVLGVLLGAPADYAARLDWVRDLLATAGIRLLEKRIDVNHVSVVDVGETETIGAILIAPDSLHSTAIPVAAAALRDAGVSQIIVAGRAGTNEESHRQSGVTGHIYAGADAVAFLSGLLQEAEGGNADS